MYRITTDVVKNYTVIQKVEEKEEIPVLIRTKDENPCIKPNKLQIKPNGIVEINGIEQSFINYVHFTGCTYEDGNFKFKDVLASGFIGKMGKLYITATDVLLVPDSEVQIISEFGSLESISIAASIKALFPVGLTPITRGLGVVPVASYSIKNLFVEYIEDAEMRMKGVVMMAFKNDQLVAIQLSGENVIPMTPIPNASIFDEHNRIFKLKPKEMNVTFEKDEIVPINPNTVHALSLFESIKNMTYDLNGVKSYVTFDTQYPVLSPSENTDFVTVTTEKPVGKNYCRVYTDFAKMVDDDYCYGYVDTEFNDKVNMFLDRLSIIEEQQIGSINTIIKKYYNEQVQKINDSLVTKGMMYQDHRKVLSNVIKISQPNLPKFDGNKVNNKEILYQNCDKILDHVFDYNNFKSAYLHNIDRILNKELNQHQKELATYWVEKLNSNKTRHYSYEGYKAWGSSAKERDVDVYNVRQDYNRPCVLNTMAKTNAGLLQLVYYAPVIHKWHASHDSQDICYNRMIEQTKEASEYAVKKWIAGQLGYTGDNVQINEIQSIDVKTEIIKRKNVIPHGTWCDWYEWPSAKTSDIEVKITAQILFKEEATKVIDVNDFDGSEYYTEQIIDRIAKDLGVTNLTDIDKICARNLQSSLQTIIDTDEEIQRLITYISEYVTRPEVEKVYVSLDGYYINASKVENSPINLLGSQRVNVNGNFSDALLKCVVPFKGENIPMSSYLEKFSISYKTNSIPTRDYSVNVELQEDASLGASCITFVYKGVTL